MANQLGHSIYGRWGKKLKMKCTICKPEINKVQLTVFDLAVVYHVTFVAVGHGLLKKFWPLVIFEIMQTRLLR